MGIIQPSPDMSKKLVLTHKAVEACIQAHLKSIRSFGVNYLALFGSVARNQATTSSDLDFLVEFNGSATFDRYMDLKFFLEDLFECPVDLITKRSLKPQLKATVLKEAIRVA